MKAFRTYKGAREASPSLPILEIECAGEHLFIAFPHSDVLSVSEARLLLIRADEHGSYCATISLRHLDRLGDGDIARAGPGPATKRCFTPHDLGEPEPRPKMIRISPNVVVKA